MKARKCQVCGKPDIAKGGGCISFRYQDPKDHMEWRRGYFHLACFKKSLKTGEFHGR